MTAPIPLISRADAKARGLKRYFTGIPCKHGHVSERNTSTTGCLACWRARYAANPGPRKARHRAWYAENAKLIASRRNAANKDRNRP
jgi:hypothetical protein